MKAFSSIKEKPTSKSVKYTHPPSVRVTRRGLCVFTIVASGSPADDAEG